MKKPRAITTHQRNRLGPFHLAQVLFIELVIAGVLFVRDVPWTWVGGATVVALILTFGYTRGNWWFSHAWNRIQLSRRRSKDKKLKTTDVVELGPTLELSDVNERNTHVGVAFDGTGWFTALAVDNGETPAHAFETFTSLLDQPNLPISSVQLVSRAIPHVQHGVTPNPALKPPWRRDTWFLVRIDMRGASSVAEMRGGGVTGIHRAFVGIVGRLVKGAARKGMHMRPLTSGEIQDVLRLTLGTDATHSHYSPGDLTETWNGWNAQDRVDATFVMSGKAPTGERLSRVWSDMQDLTVDAQTISIAFRRASTRPSEKRTYLRCLVRLSADKKTIDVACRKLAETARTQRVRLHRANGVQGPAAYASAASGGTW